MVFRTTMLLLACCAATGLLFAQKKQVIVMGFDGLSGHGLEKANPPFFRWAAENGAYTYHSRSVFPTSSSSNWASMINGSSVRKHQVKSNRWERSQMSQKSYCGQKKGEIFPTLFKAIREQKPDAQVAVVHDWDGFARLANTECMNVCINAAGEFATADSARKIILQQFPDLLFLHFDHVDHAGHAYGHMSQAYLQSIAVADSLAQAVWNAVIQAGKAEETLLIITSDHGGIGKGHGGATFREFRIPFIAYGPGIPKGEIRQRVRQIHTAPTILSYMGCKIPECWNGKPIAEILPK